MRTCYRIRVKAFSHLSYTKRTNIVLNHECALAFIDGAPHITRFAGFHNRHALYWVRTNIRPRFRSPALSFSSSWILQRRILVSLKITVARARFHLSSTKKSNWSTESQSVFMVAKKVLLSLSHCHHRPGHIQYTWHKRGKFSQFGIMMAACLSFSRKNGKHVHQWKLSPYAISACCFLLWFNNFLNFFFFSNNFWKRTSTYLIRYILKVLCTISIVDYIWLTLFRLL